MTHGGRYVRRIAAVLLTLGLAGFAAPAQAANDSPENAVNALWDNLQFGRPERAVAQLLPACRKVGRRVFANVSRRLSKALDRTPYYLTVRNYSEKVSGRNSRVRYDLHIEGGYFDEYVDTFPRQRWVLTGSKWFLDCRTF